MDSSPLPTPPKKNLLQWALANPGAFEAYMQRVVALSRLEIVVKRASGVTRVPIEFSRENSVASLPPIELEASASDSGNSSGGGDVFGPASATPENLAAFFDSSGKRIKDSGAALAQIDPRGLHSLWFPAAVMAPSFSGGCAPLSTVGALDISGGSSTVISGGWKIITFLASGNLTVTGTGTLEFLLVGGGGGGGGFGGGGAGRFVRSSVVGIASGVYPIVIGAGGAGTAGGATAGTRGTNGGDSTFNSITAPGGGGGGAFSDTVPQGKDGGSGGGGGTDASAPFTGRNGGAATGSAGTGNAGGNGVTGATSTGAGGGAGGAGGNGSGTTGGTGGAGTADSISGASVTYAAGGGGAGQLTAGNGGSSNTGGKGAAYNADAGPAATAPVAATGSGGGAKYANATAGATAGAAGIFICRIPV